MRGDLAVLIVGLLLSGASAADTQSSPTRADEALAPAPLASRGPAGVVADQIAARPGAADVSAGQITSAAGGSATAASQLAGSAPRADAPAQLSTPSQGRNVRMAVVKGHDRCDPAAGASARRTECAQFIDKRVDEFAGPAEDQLAPVVHADAPPSNMVNDILNGGTGSVVALPTK